MKNYNLFAHLKSDVASGLVVFLVALPLCLGIAMASGAPLFSGIIAGIIGGIVVGFLSQSHVSVSPEKGIEVLLKGFKRSYLLKNDVDAKDNHVFMEHQRASNWPKGNGSHKALITELSKEK